MKEQRIKRIAHWSKNWSSFSDPRDILSHLQGTQVSAITVSDRKVSYLTGSPPFSDPRLSDVFLATPETLQDLVDQGHAFLGMAFPDIRHKFGSGSREDSVLRHIEVPDAILFVDEIEGKWERV